MGRSTANPSRNELIWLFGMVAALCAVLTLGLLQLVRKQPGSNASQLIFAALAGLASAAVLIYLLSRPIQRRQTHISSIINGHFSRIPFPPSPPAAITKAEPFWYVFVASGIWAAWLFLGLSLAPDRVTWFFLPAALAQTVWERWRGRSWIKVFA